MTLPRCAWLREWSDVVERVGGFPFPEHERVAAATDVEVAR
jgi:hypothetical protein